MPPVVERINSNGIKWKILHCKHSKKKSLYMIYIIMYLRASGWMIDSAKIIYPYIRELVIHFKDSFSFFFPTSLPFRLLSPFNPYFFSIATYMEDHPKG